MLGDDLSASELDWCASRLVPEAVGLTTEPVALAMVSRPAEVARLLNGLAT